MIKGIGVDIEEVSRFRKLPYKSNQFFYKKIFTPVEIKYCLSKADPYQHFAARFAAKEAVLKAFGDNAHIGWKDIKIINDKNGKPLCIYKDRNFKKQILISISHTKNYAVASALIAS